MIHIKSIFIICFLLIIRMTTSAQNDIFLVQGLPKEILSSKVKSCNVYNVDTIGVKNLKFTKKYNKGLLYMEIDFTNSNITKYKYNNITRIGEIENLYFEGSDTSLILSKSVSVFFYNESKQIDRIETTDSNSKEIIRFVYDEYNRIKEKKCVNGFDSLLWAQNYSYDTLYDGIVEVKIISGLFANKEFIDGNGRKIKSISNNTYSYYFWNEENLQRMYQRISFDTNGDIDYIESELYFYNENALMTRKEVYANSQLKFLVFFTYNRANLPDEIKIAKATSINSPQLAEVCKYQYYP